VFYLITILLGTLATALLDFATAPHPDPTVAAQSLLWAASAAAAVFLLDAITAFLIRRLPERWFSPLSPAFSVGEKERRLLRRLGVLRWKHLVPEWGACSGFRKNELQSATEKEYLARFLLESNYGVVIHLVNAIVGFALLPIPFVGGITVGLPVAVINGFLSLLPVMILRYHTAPLRRLYTRAQKRGTDEARAQ
jgi:hypothetical protein